MTGWALREGKKERRVDEIFVHWSASPFGDRDTINQWHRERGFLQIGYHAVILNGHRTSRSLYDENVDGKIELGRPEWKMPAATKKHNRHSLAVCLIGDPSRRPTIAQARSLVYWLKTKCRQYDIPYDRVRAHQDVASTLCPGVKIGVIRSLLRGVT